jgi:flagellin-like hook-associated protein FlgL
MPQNTISLSAATRTNLLSLQRTTSLIDRTQNRLSTGKKVNSAMDDAMAFFTSRALTNRASDLDTIKAGIKEGISQIETAVQTLESIEDVLKQMKAVASSARSTDSADSNSREKLRVQFNELRSQIDHLVNDSVYNGVNLVKSGADTLTVKFSEIQDARALMIEGVRSDASGLAVQEAGSSGVTATEWASSASYVSNITSAMEEVDSALATVRTTAQTFGANASMLEIRKEFTENLVNTLEGGAADLVNADLNEESANMLALQTRQQLGTIALSMAQQSQQGVLRLF